MKARKGFIYVFETEAHCRIKIGFSANPSDRVKQINTPWPLVVTACVPAYDTDEANLHAALKHARAYREWYDRTHPDVEKVRIILCSDTSFAPGFLAMLRFEKTIERTIIVLASVSPGRFVSLFRTQSAESQ